MSRRPAAITQADISRAIRAAKKNGAASVRVEIGKASIVVEIERASTAPEQALDTEGEIVL